ncbi:hypothetical protein DL770_009697 [Monosporascus sp. CRB-9-2]|nr:hypothetical protein DL770_009697 [Monosporascus sp. CRB-9-2]
MKSNYTTYLLTASATLACLATARTITQDELSESYDYVVVGGGTGGMALGNRLSEDSSKTVLVIEAGPVDAGEKEIMIPRYYVGANGPYTAAKFNWNASTTPQEALGGRQIIFTQGKLIGGGSALNAMVYDRGRPSDYDSWSALNNPGWDFNGLLPYFKKAETFTPPPDDQVAEFGVTWNPECHGTDGPVQSSYCQYVYPQHNNFMAAMKSLGVPQPLDQSCGDTLGAYLTTHSIHPTNQSRSFGRTAWYDPSIERRNLHVLIETQVTKLVTNEDSDDVTISGIEFASSADAKRRTVKVSKEAILSAGALRSPHLLMLSGIGEKAQLDRHGIKTIVNIPGVGQNLQDHAIGSFAMSIDQSLETAADLEDPEFDALQGKKYYESRTGRWTDGLPASLAFIPYLNFTSDPDTVLDAMNATLAIDYLPNGTDPTVIAGYVAQVNHIIDMHRARSTAGQELMYLNGGQLFVTILLHPLSRGTVKLASAEPFDYPLVDPRYLSHPSDTKLYVDALKYDRKIIATDAMKKISAKELFPGADVTDDNALGAIVAGGLSTVWHPAGTCAMMPKELGGVVDSQLKVYGVKNLRVVDASVVPLIQAAHMQATVYAIAEKASHSHYGLFNVMTY